MSEQYPITNASLEAIIGMLMLRLADNPKVMHYIDIYPVDPREDPPRYTYEHWEQPNG